MATYYNDAGKKLTGKDLKKALKNGSAYTREALEQKYNGFDIGVIRKAGDMRRFLLEAPKQHKSLTDEEINAKAAAQADTEANTAKASAQSLYNSNKTTLENEAAGLDSVYQPQIASAQKQTAQNVDSLQGSMLSRGLGRSSYAGALQQATQQAGTNAVNSILSDKSQKQSAIGNQLSTLGTNYNTAMSTIDQNRNSTIKTAYDAMKQQDYEQGLSTADARTTFLWNLLNQKKKVSSSSGSSRRSSGSSGSSSSGGSSGSGGNWLQDLFNSFFG